MQSYYYPLAGCLPHCIHKVWWLPSHSGGDCDFEATGAGGWETEAGGKISDNSSTQSSGASIINISLIFIIITSQFT